MKAEWLLAKNLPAKPLGLRDAHWHADNVAHNAFETDKHITFNKMLRSSACWKAIMSILCHCQSRLPLNEWLATTGAGTPLKADRKNAPSIKEGGSGQ